MELRSGGGVGELETWNIEVTSMLSSSLGDLSDEYTNPLLEDRSGWSGGMAGGASYGGSFVEYDFNLVSTSASATILDDDRWRAIVETSDANATERLPNEMCDFTRIEAQLDIKLGKHCHYMKNVVIGMERLHGIEI